MALWFCLLMIALGIALLFFGKRLWVLGAGVGALLGIGFLNFIPGTQTGFFGIGLILGLAILLSVLTVFIKGFTTLIAAGLGFVAGGAVTLSFLDMFSINAGLFGFLIALVGAGIGAVLGARFFKIVIAVIAGIVGALLAVRGLQLLLGPETLNGVFGTLLTIVLAGFGIWNQSKEK
jgi:hypothetical protein